MKEIKIKRKWLSIAAIIFLLLSLLLAFGWVNSEVSYKYEVQDTLYSGKPLDEHQKDIQNDIASSKVELIFCVLLLIFTLILRETELTFKSRVSYYDKSSNNA